MTWSLRRNTDPALPASHTIEIMFKLPTDFAGGGISNVPGMLMKQAEQTRGVPLAGMAVKVTNGILPDRAVRRRGRPRAQHPVAQGAGWFDIPWSTTTTAAPSWRSRRARRASAFRRGVRRLEAVSFQCWSRRTMPIRTSY